LLKGVHIDRAFDHLRLGRAPLHPGGVDPAIKAVQADVAHAAQEVVGAFTMLLNAHGSGGFAESNPLHRMWQDANMGARHDLITPGTSYEIYGRALLDMPIGITPAV
jgi:alkylation response protein AidB-like acyl-CoA dehydrogenase